PDAGLPSRKPHEAVPGLALERCIHGTDQPVHVGVKVATGGDFRGVVECQTLETLRQLFRLRHAGATDEYRDRRDAALQRSLDLDAPRISLVEDAGEPRRRSAEPV